jgi:small subunit ribosomal protein S9
VGEGKRIINGKSPQDYFKRQVLLHIIETPFDITKTGDKFDLHANIEGGGLSSQAGALSLGIARALIKFDRDMRRVLKPKGLLKRDPREVERKKYGHPKARKRFQFSKR